MQRIRLSHTAYFDRERERKKFVNTAASVAESILRVDLRTLTSFISRSGWTVL